MKTIAPKELHARIAKGETIDLIDVRTPAEYRSWHTEHAVLAPLASLDCKKVLASRKAEADAPLYVMCKSGMRSAQACQQFVAAGYENVVNVEGGIQAWDAAKLPVTRQGREMISVDRQVRITVGAMIIVTALLGIYVASWVAWLPLVFGAGLLQSGITDTCPLAMVIAKMPWNQ